MIDDAVIVGASRTPIGRFLGALKDVPATKLGAIVVAEVLRRARVEPGQVDEVIMGNVLSAGLGQAPARQAAIGAGIPVEAGAVTINKVCGSGLKAVMLGAQAVALGDKEIVVAGGMESMSRAPHVTAGNAPGTNDGAAAVILTSARKAQALGLGRAWLRATPHPPEGVCVDPDQRSALSGWRAPPRPALRTATRLAMRRSLEPLGPDRGKR